jgi:hypothetical protein
MTAAMSERMLFESFLFESVLFKSPPHALCRYRSIC